MYEKVYYTLRMVHKWIQKVIAKQVEDYLSRLPDDKLQVVATRVISAQGLTEGVYRKLVESAKGDTTVTIYFPDGARAIISNTAPVKIGGPGW